MHGSFSPAALWACAPAGCGRVHQRDTPSDDNRQEATNHLQPLECPTAHRTGDVNWPAESPGGASLGPHSGYPVSKLGTQWQGRLAQHTHSQAVCYIVHKPHLSLIHI